VNPVALEGPISGAVVLALAVPFALGALLLPAARARFLAARVVAIIAAQLFVLTVAVRTFADLAAAGGLRNYDVGGYDGARLLVVDPLALVPLDIDPARAFLWLVLALAGFATCIGSIADARDRKSTAPLTLVLVATAASSIAATAAHLSGVAAGVAIAGVAGLGALAATSPPRSAVAALGRLAIVQQVSNVLLCVFVFALAADAPPITLEPWTRATSGPFTGFAARELWQLGGALVAVAGFVRALGVPLFFAARDATSGPPALSGFVHAVTSLAMGALLLVRAQSALALAPEALSALGFAGALTALLAALVALAGRDVRRIDLHALVAFTGLVLVAVAALDDAVALLGLALLVLAGVPLVASGASLVAQAKERDPLALRGLESILPRTHTARLVAVGALVGTGSGALFAVHIVASAWLAPWLGAPVALLALAAIGVLTLACFRVLHASFGGARASAGADAAAHEPAKERFQLAHVAWIGLALVAVALALLDVPRGVWGLLPLQVDARPPLEGIALMERLAQAPVRAVLLAPRTPPPLSPAQLALLVLAVLVAAYTASTVLYRRGAHARLGDGRLARAVTRLAAVAGREDRPTGDVGEGAVRLSRLIAMNLAPAILETALRRLPGLASMATAFVIRALASGSAQRGVLLVIVTAAALLWWWT
jgi:NADH:ubiquinone oxidoreductase subunit 5 (subunit L)/multisubunit Na+/H+ antiporter MnhA subunit